MYKVMGITRGRGFQSKRYNSVQRITVNPGLEQINVVVIEEAAYWESLPNGSGSK